MAVYRILVKYVKTHVLVTHLPASGPASDHKFGKTLVHAAQIITWHRHVTWSRSQRLAQSGLARLRVTREPYNGGKHWSRDTSPRRTSRLDNAWAFMWTSTRGGSCWYGTVWWRHSIKWRHRLINFYLPSERSLNKDHIITNMDQVVQ